jgi:very-short-patch-repair endonuclease
MPRRTLPSGNRALAKHMRRKMPDAEFKLWCELRNGALDGLKFRRQQPMGNYIVDFYCADAKLIVEVDGEQHSTPEHRRADAERTKWFEAQGYRVVRFWTNEVMHELEGVCAAILAASRGEWSNPPSETGRHRSRKERSRALSSRRPFQPVGRRPICAAIPPPEVRRRSARRTSTSPQGGGYPRLRLR